MNFFPVKSDFQAEYDIFFQKRERLFSLATLFFLLCFAFAAPEGQGAVSAMEQGAVSAMEQGAVGARERGASEFGMRGAPERPQARQKVFEERREYQGYVRRGMAEKAAKLAALSFAYADVELFLARNEDLRFADSSGSGGLAAPLPLDGLAHMLFRVSIVRTGVEGFPPRLWATAQSVWEGPDDLRQALLAALKQPDKLELYAQTLREKRRLLARYDALAPALLSRQPYEQGGQEEAHYLQSLINEMSAVEILRDLLPEYESRWKDPERAAAVLARAGELAPANPLLLTVLAEAELQMDRPVRALEMAGQAIASRPDFARAHDVKGTALLRQRLPVLAEEAFSRALELFPKNSTYFTHRAAARLILEDLPGMCRDFAEACGLGDCEGLQWGRSSGSCPEEKER